MKINDYEILEDRLYTKEHEWIKLYEEYAIIGITDYAAKLLNDIVYVEMPEIEKELKAGESFGSVESVKTASEVYLPVSGRVVEINNELNESPEIINNSPYEKGWIIKIKPSNYEKEKLSKNGFLVYPTDGNQLFHIYEHNDYLGIPSFISVDAVLQLYHLYFGMTLRNIETKYLHREYFVMSKNCIDYTNSCSI